MLTQSRIFPEIFELVRWLLRVVFSACMPRCRDDALRALRLSLVIARSRFALRRRCRVMSMRPAVCGKANAVVHTLAIPLRRHTHGSSKEIRSKEVRKSSEQARRKRDAATQEGHASQWKGRK